MARAREWLTVGGLLAIVSGACGTRSALVPSEPPLGGAWLDDRRMGVRVTMHENAQIVLVAGTSCEDAIMFENYPFYYVTGIFSLCQAYCVCADCAYAGGTTRGLVQGWTGTPPRGPCNDPRSQDDVRCSWSTWGGDDVDESLIARLDIDRQTATEQSGTLHFIDPVGRRHTLHYRSPVTNVENLYNDHYAPYRELCAFAPMDEPGFRACCPAGQDAGAD